MTMSARVPFGVSPCVRDRLRAGLLLALAAALAFGLARPAAAQVRGEWLGAYVGVLAPRGELALGASPTGLGAAEAQPVPFALAVRAHEDGLELVLRIDGGPMTTAAAGETLRFAAPGFGVSAREARLAPGGVAGEAEAGSLRLYPDPRSREPSDMLMIESLHRQGDDSLSRRQIGVRFVDSGAEVLLWVFDRTGYRARAWRADLRRIPDAR